MPETIVGKNLGNLSLINQDGDTVSIGNYSGKKLILWWFPKADTPGWTLEGEGFRDRIQDFKDRNVSIVGVSFDSPTDNCGFRDKFSFPYDLLSDTEGKMSDAFGVSEPGSARPPRKSVLMGPDGKVAVTYDKVAPADHPDQVIEDLDSMS